MNPRSLIRAALVVGGVALWGDSEAASPSAEMLSRPCAACHGTDGVSHGPSIPTIAGLSKDYFTGAMQAYRSGKRAATVMGRIAKGYTDPQFELMADFFAEKAFVPMTQKANPKLAAAGRKLHEQYCEACHRNGGRSPEFGILAGQAMPYLRQTLADFQSGAREIPAAMQERVQTLRKEAGEQCIDQLVNYYGSQR